MCIKKATVICLRQKRFFYHFIWLYFVSSSYTALNETTRLLSWVWCNSFLDKLTLNASQIDVKMILLSRQNKTIYRKCTGIFIPICLMVKMSIDSPVSTLLILHSNEYILKLPITVNKIVQWLCTTYLYGDSKVVAVFNSWDKKLNPHFHLLKTKVQQMVSSLQIGIFFLFFILYM